MSKAVVEMLHRWWRRLAETELIRAECTQEDLLHLLDLPAPGETVALNQIGLARVTISDPVDNLTVCFLEPLVFEDVVAVFGPWTPGIYAPDSCETPCCYGGHGFGATRFRFNVRGMITVSETRDVRCIDVCYSLFISLPFGRKTYLAPGPPITTTPPLAPIVTPPVGRFRLWLRRLRSR